MSKVRFQVQSLPVYVMPRGFWIILGVFFLVVGFLTTLLAEDISAGDWWVNTAWCVVSGFSVVWALNSAFKKGVVVLFGDHLVMLTLTFFIYYVVGAALLSVGPQEQIDSALSFYRVDASQATLVNGANSIGFGLMLLAGSLSSTRWSGRGAKVMSELSKKISPRLAILIFLVIGFWASIQVVISDIAMPDDVVDGSLRALSKFSLVAIFLGISYVGRGEKWIRGLVIVVAFLSSFVGLLLFNKTEFFLPLGVLLTGYAIRARSKKIFWIGVLVILFLFAMLGNVVAYSRNTYTDTGRDFIESRWSVILEGFASSSRQTVEGEYHPWARFCYTPSFAAGMYLYDVGRGGQDFERLPWIFVPRFIDPDKPVISQAGSEFYTKITGQVGSSTGLGVFVSGYYNLGWIGLVAASLMCGWVLAQTSRIALEILARKAYVLLPFALIGTYMAFRIDGHFVNDYLGVFIFLLYPILIFGWFGAGRAR